MLHFIFFRDFFPSLPVLLPSESIFRARISLIRSKNTLSTFSRVLAEVSTYGTFQASAWARALARGTARRSVRSLLFPTRINGMVSSPLTRRICSRNSWVDCKTKKEKGKLVLAKENYCGRTSSDWPVTYITKMFCLRPQKHGKKGRNELHRNTYLLLMQIFFAFIKSAWKQCLFMLCKISQKLHYCMQKMQVGKGEIFRPKT